MAERNIQGKEMPLYRASLTKQVLASVTVVDGGSGYDSTPLISFTGGGVGAVLPTAHAVMSGSGPSQVVASIVVDTVGSNITAALVVVFTGGTPADSATATAVLTPEYELMGCLTSHDLDQTSAAISTDTFCGKISLPGTKDAKVSFAMIVLLSPDAGKVAINTLQGDYNTGDYQNWKITSLDQVAGDIIWTFRAFLESFKFSANSTDLYNASGSLQVDENGATMEIIA